MEEALKLTEEETQILQQLKNKLGFKSNVRDEYLTYIIKGCIQDLENRNGLKIDFNDIGHLMFVVDLADLRYTSGDSQMPRNLQLRLHDLIYDKKS